MAEGAVLDPPGEEVAEVVDEATEPQETPEVPSVFSVTNRYIIGRVDVTPPAEDGSRVVRLYSGNAGAVIEANLSPQLCEFVSGKLVEVEVIAEDDEDAGSSE